MSAAEGSLFKCHLTSGQYVTSKGDIITFLPSPKGGSQFVTQDADHIAELTQASKNPTSRIYIDPAETTAFTAEAIQEAFKRKIIEDFLAAQQLNPENSTYTTTNETGIVAASTLDVSGTEVGKAAPAVVAPTIVKVK
jgi:hypothetical protein